MAIWLMPLAILAAVASTDDGQSTAARSFAGAVAALQNRMGDLTTNAPLPRKSDPQNAPLFAEITSSIDELGSPAFPVDGLSTFESVCGPLNAIGVRYMLNNINSISSSGPRTPEISQQLQAKALANFMKFQDEVSVTNSAMLICFARHLPAAEAFLDTLPTDQRTEIRMKGARGWRDHAGNALFDEMMATANPRLTLANKRLAAHAVDVSADAIAARMTITQRQTLRGRMIPVAQIPAEFRPLYLRVRSLFESQACQGLCKLG